MPIYDFICRQCHKPFAIQAKMGSTPNCPFCGTDDPEKKLSSFAIIGCKGAGKGTSAQHSHGNHDGESPCHHPSSSSGCMAEAGCGGSCGCSADYADTLIQKHLGK